MNRNSTTHALGVQLTDSGTCLLLVERARGDAGFHVAASGFIDNQQEGIVSSTESREAIQSWLCAHSQERTPVTAVMSQNDVSCTVNHFPQMDDREKLQKLVDYQAQHLGGIADERFISDFVQYTSSLDNTTRTLVLLAREKKAEEALDFFRDASLKVVHLTSEGLALCNALFILQPEASSEAGGLTAVLNITNDHPLVALLFHGELQAVFELESPSTLLRMPLESRLQSYIRKLPLAPEIDKSQFSRIYISGSPSELKELNDRLQSCFRCPVVTLQVPLNGMEPDSRFVIAFGAALQGIGLARYMLELKPFSLAWSNQRRRSIHYLRWAFLAVLLTLFTFVTLFIRHLKVLESDIRQRELSLAQCQAMEKNLEECYERIEVAQRKLKPLQEYSGRSTLFLNCLKEWNNCYSKGAGWIIYMGDEFTFKLVNDSEKRAAQRSSQNDTTSELLEHLPDEQQVPPAEAMVPQPLEPPMLGLITAPESAPAFVQTPSQEFPPRRLVGTIKSVQAVYIGGYAGATSGAMYQSVKALQDKLNASPLFTNVDDCLDKTSKGFLETYFTPWSTFLEQHKETIKQKNTPFLLRLPLDETEKNSSSTEEE